MNLEIILRTCKRSDITKHANFDRICGTDRSLMMGKCITSLINSINFSKNNIKLSILDDHSDKDFLDFLNNLSKKCNKTVEIISLDQTGHNLTLLAQIEKAKNSTDLVYILEDDYLHETDAIDNMIVAYNVLLNRYRTEVVLYPFDDPLRYMPNKEEPTILLFDGKRYWRQTTKTTMCIFTHSRVLKNNFDVFKKLALEMPNVWEDETINRLYKNFITGSGNILAMSPIPSIAYHLSYTEPAVIKSDHLSWNDLWKNNYQNLLDKT